jgi:hypothetical protein
MSGSASMMARIGTSGQLVLAGGAAVALANLIGVIVEDWSTDLRFWLVLLGSLAAIAVTLMRTTAIVGIPGRSWVRIDAAIVAAFALVDLGDTASSLGDWTILSIILTLIEVAGAAALAYGAWSLSGGSLAADVTGARKVMAMEMIDRFVYLGAVGVIVGWFILMAIADVYNFTLWPQVGVLAAVLVLGARWVNRNPAAGTLPVPHGWLVLGLGGIAVLAGLWWLINVLGRTFEIGGLTTYVPLLIYALALVSLGLGAFLGLGSAMPKKPGI